MSKKQNSEIQAWHSFLWAHTVILSKLEREMRDELRLPLPWFDVLAQLEHAPEGAGGVRSSARRSLQGDSTSFWSSTSACC